MSILQQVKTEIEVFGPIKAKAHATMKCAEIMSSSEKITMAEAHRLIGYIQTGNETYLTLRRSTMKATLTGVVLEKFLKHSQKENEEPKTMVRLYQQGEKINTDVTVLPDTYEKAKEGQKISINCTVGAYAFNGQSGLYAKEADRF